MKFLDAALSKSNLPDIDTIVNSEMIKRMKNAENYHYEFTDDGSPVFHPSFFGKCPRQLVFNFLNLNSEEEDDEEVEYDTVFHRICRVGDALHEYYQSLMADSGLLYGDYDCIHCDKKVVEGGLKPKRCPECARSTGIRYSEMRLRMESPIAMSGRGDGIIIPDINGKYAHFMELKSISHFMYDSRYTPLPLDEHVQQVNAYMGMQQSVKLNGRTYKIKDSFILYENKNTQARKTHWVSFDEDVFKEDLRYAKMIIRNIKAGTLPKRPTKYTPKSYRCKNCAYREDCYATG